MNVIWEALSLLLHTWLRGSAAGVLLRQEVMWVHEKLWRNGAGEGGSRRENGRQ